MSELETVQGLDQCVPSGQFVADAAKNEFYRRLAAPLCDVVLQSANDASEAIESAISRAALARLLISPGGGADDSDNRRMLEAAARIPGRLELLLNTRAASKTPTHHIETTLGFHSFDLPDGVDSLRQLYATSHGGDADISLEQQIQGGMGTGDIAYKLLSADVYMQLIGAGVSADERPEIAHELLDSRAFTAANLLIASRMHIKTHLGKIIENTVTRSRDDLLRGGSLIKAEASPFVLSQSRGAFALEVNKQAIGERWSQVGENAGTSVVGCPARLAVVLSEGDVPQSAIQLAVMNNNAFLLHTGAFEAYEDFVAQAA